MQKKSKLNVFTFMMLIILSLTFQSAISIYAACPEEISSYWKLDETAGPDYVDFIKDNDGAGNVDPTAVVGQINGAQEFNGSTTGIDVPADRSFNWAVDESFSIEFWVKRNGTAGAEQVAIGRSAGPPASSLTWWAGIDAGTTASFVLGDNNGGNIAVLTGTTDITDNEWHHVVAIRDRSLGANGQNLLYVDGQLDVAALDATYNAGFDSATAELNIGYWNFETTTPSNHLGGMMDEVALYDRALTAEEIEDHYDDGLAGQDYCLGSAPFAPFPDDTISLWDLDEANGPDYVDSFNGNDGAGNVDPTAVVGQINGAQEFNGSTTGIDVPADKSFNWAVDESFSIEFWVKRNGAAGAEQVAIGRSAGPPASSLTWWAGIDAGTTASFVLGDNNGGNIAVLTGATDITDNEWHHVVAIRDRSLGANGQNLLYVDGQLDVAALDATYNAGFDSATAELNIGYWNFETTTPSNHLGGMIDEVALYDRALTSDEIEDHYEDGLLGNGIEDTGGIAEIIGTWSDGIWYRDVAESRWTKMTSFTTTGDIAAGDFTGDGIADVASIWPGSLWYQDGATLAWTEIPVNTPGGVPNGVTAGDVTGDGRFEIIGTWSSGIWYRDVAASSWTQMTSFTTTGDIAAGDFTGDGIADVASIWPGSLWYQDGATLAWTEIPVNTPGGVPNGVTAGDVTGDGRFEIIGTWSSGIWYRDVAASSWTQMTSFTTTGDIAAGDFTGDGIADVASIWPGSLWYQDGATLDWTEIPGPAPNRVTAGDVTGQ